MAKDYFDDILSQQDNSSRPRPSPPQEKTPPSFANSEEKARPDFPPLSGVAAQGPSVYGGGRTIRNITVSPRRAAKAGGMRDISSGITPPGFPPAPKSGNPRRKWVWAVAIASLAVLALLGLFAFRSTKVTVIPHSRQVNLEQGKEFTAYPAASAREGNLTYTVATSDLEDSAVVPSKGTENVSERGSGAITVYNEYSSSPVRLIKNTRFATPDGLVFRAPASVVIPGKKGSAPGSVSVTVFADQPGAEFNVGPVARFTLPGLKDSGEMYSKIYARSSSPMSGGFVGERPAVAPGALESARSEVRSRLETKALEGARALPKDASAVFTDLIRIAYSSLPETAEAGGGLRIYEKAHVEIPVFPASLFASAVYYAVDREADNAAVALAETDSLTAKQSGSLGSALGSGPLDFTLTGKTTLVWKVDESALAAALAGSNQNSFQDIIKGFPSIAEARATIEPFWKNSFPQDAGEIRVVIIENIK